MYVYAVTFLINGIHPDFLEGIWPGLPEVPDRYEVVIVNQEKPITDQSQLAAIELIGKEKFGQRREVEDIEYEPKVDIHAINYLGCHPDEVQAPV